MNPPVYEKHPPPPGLAPWVVAIWSLRLTAGAPHRILPDGYMDLIALPDGALLVAGPTTRPELAAPVDGVVRGLRLMPGAAPALLGVTAHQLRDRTVPLSELWGAAAARPLAGTLLARAARARSDPDPLVGAVVAALVRDPSQVEHGEEHRPRGDGGERQRRAGGDRERARPQQPRGQERVRHAALDDAERREQRGRPHQRRQGAAVAEPGLLDAGQPEDEQRQPGGDRDRAREVHCPTCRSRPSASRSPRGS